MLLLMLLLAASVAWPLMTHYVVDWQLYRKDATEVDLRGREISISHYEKVKEKLPAARICWDVPFQGGVLPEDLRELTVTELSQEDAGILAAYLPQLRKVDGEGCTDYESLALLKTLRPDLRVEYSVPLNGRRYVGNALKVTLEDPTGEDLARMESLPRLNRVTVTGGRAEMMDALRQYVQVRDLKLTIQIQGQSFAPDTTVLEVTGITELELPLLELMPGLKRVRLTEPEASPEALAAMREARPGVDICWQKELMGLTFTSNDTKIDLTEVLALRPGQKPGTETAYQQCADYPCMGEDEEEPSAIKLLEHRKLPDKTDMTQDLIREAEEVMAYFPDAEKLVMVGCFLDNVQMDQFRQNHREDYDVVWLVECGGLAARTDARLFMPTKYRVYYLRDWQTENLRYLNEVVALDLGHMYITEISFVEYMPNLEYVVLAHSDVRSIEPLRSCKKLKFLEVDWTPTKDFSPLVDCPALEDLNIGNTWGDIEGLKQVTWLKNLWMIGRSPDLELSRHLPTTRIQIAGGATVDAGWRELPNYYAMRDTLKMFYMDA